MRAALGHVGRSIPDAFTLRGVRYAGCAPGAGAVSGARARQTLRGRSLPSPRRLDLAGPPRG
eukprot:3676465-Lingulodinium_polyedra.AAC.1